MTDLTPRVTAWLNADRLAADLELDGLLDADTIRQMDMATYAQLRQRAGLAPFEPPTAEDRADAAGDPVTLVPAAVEAQNPAHSVEAMSWDEYAEYRKTIGLGRPGQGLFGN